MKTYPDNILKIAEAEIKKNCSDLIEVIPVFGRGFIAVNKCEDGSISYKPFIQVGTHLKDYIDVHRSVFSFDCYDEALIALITFRNLGESSHSNVYIDMYCNKIGVTTHSNSTALDF